MVMRKRIAVKGGLHPSARKGSEKAPATPGVLRPETGTLRLPSDLEDAPPNSLVPHKVVVVIAMLWLLFIAIIIWFVANMPPKGG